MFQAYEPEMRVKLIESTTDPVAFDPAKPHSGVQISYASERVAGYDGAVYCAQIGPRERSEFKLRPFLAFCAAMEGRPYDTGDIARMALDPLHLFCCGDSYKEFICSQLGCALEKLEGILPAWVNSKTVTPEDEVSFKIWAEDYSQLSGRPAALKGFNSIDPLKWRGHAA